ncbi:PREDICTED: uncharacterized protein LOC104743454 [Camelina sativa]|uniref:Uncharacterized protein LOC104743454 n=1 Tax=Camelina sativa TaxID=90675 RepID=A0ABM0VY16_CAMSA|nr:PREDICTED: uncharacterized protein LOC104743454 [Camelina sativa]
MLDKAAKDRRVGYHPRCKNISLTHLCFADDLLVFTDGTKTSIEGILQVFHDFTGFYGLNISLEKSTLYMAGVTVSEKDAILHSFPFASGTLPVRYLGLPLLTKPHQFSHPQSHKLLDVSFPLANSLYKGDRQYVICVLVVRSLSQCKKAKVSWSDVCTPKEDGGLGLRSLKEANKGSFWSLQENSTSGSWMWRKLLKYRALAVEFVRYEVNNGKHISFWHDNWSPLGCLFKLAGSRGTIDIGIGLHATVAEALTHRQRHHQVEYLNQLETVLTSVRNRGLLETEDKVLWRGNRIVLRPNLAPKKLGNIPGSQDRGNHGLLVSGFPKPHPNTPLLSGSPC